VSRDSRTDLDGGGGLKRFCRAVAMGVHSVCQGGAVPCHCFLEVRSVLGRRIRRAPKPCVGRVHSVCGDGAVPCPINIWYEASSFYKNTAYLPSFSVQGIKKRPAAPWVEIRDFSE
jgi:hypothetical protein